MICPKCNSYTKISKNGNYFCVECKITIMLYSIDFSKFSFFQIGDNYDTQIFFGINAMKKCIKYLISFKFLECDITAICSWTDGKNRLVISGNYNSHNVFIGNKKIHAKIYLINDNYTIFSSQNNADSGLIEHAVLIKDYNLNRDIQHKLIEIQEIIYNSKVKIIGGKK